MNFIKDLLFDRIDDDSFGGYGEDDALAREPVPDYIIPEKRIISTLQCGTILPMRQCGNTTRQVDWAVQKLYEGEQIKCQDHYMGGRDKGANEGLLQQIRTRLNHSGLKALIVSKLNSPTDMAENILIGFTDEYLQAIFDNQRKI